MSKELEALERLMNKCCDRCFNDAICVKETNNSCSAFQNYKIIETALKRSIELEKSFNTLSKENEMIMKELSKEIENNRVLEIIKNYFWLEDYQDFITFNGALPKKFKEKCDLLKEKIGSL